ncbi:MAG: PIG-L family deacetylase [Candidatus Bathyarchaeota archaeon]|nr:MAG: PIG-L family deacetylase [Candidatus Bathyarchaeota archaeon]
MADLSPIWLLTILKPRALLVVTHADDETIFAGGLILSSRETEWTIICANPKSEEREQEFFSACNFFENNSSNPIHPVVFKPVLDQKGILNLDWLVQELRPYRSSYDFVVTHNREGEYGNTNHQVVHRAVMKSLADSNVWVFISPGSTGVDQENLKSKHPEGNLTLKLTPRVRALKLEAFQVCHQSQASLYGYDPALQELKDTYLKGTLQWEFESGKEQYTFHI